MPVVNTRNLINFWFIGIFSLLKTSSAHMLILSCRFWCNFSSSFWRRLNKFLSLADDIWSFVHFYSQMMSCEDEESTDCVLNILHFLQKSTYYFIWSLTYSKNLNSKLNAIFYFTKWLIKKPDANLSTHRGSCRNNWIIKNFMSVSSRLGY